MVRNESLRFGAEALKAKAEMEKSGYFAPPRPSFELPTVPQEITDLSDDLLMSLFTKLVRWSDHIAGLLALAEVDERCAESTYDLVWAEVLATISAGRTRNERTVTIDKATAMQDPEVIARIEEKDMAYGRRKMLAMMFANLERDANLLSRELTRRVGRHDRGARADRLNP